MRLLIVLLILLLQIPQTCAKESYEDQITFKDFTLHIGEGIDIGNYRAELIEIRSVRDRLAVMRISKVSGGLDEQRTLFQNSGNNFNGGAKNDGITITVTDILDEQSAKVRVEYKDSLGTARKSTRKGCPPPKTFPS